MTGRAFAKAVGGPDAEANTASNRGKLLRRAPVGDRDGRELRRRVPAVRDRPRLLRARGLRGLARVRGRKQRVRRDRGNHRRHVHDARADPAAHDEPDVCTLRVSNAGPEREADVIAFRVSHPKAERAAEQKPDPTADGIAVLVPNTSTKREAEQEPDPPAHGKSDVITFRVPDTGADTGAERGAISQAVTGTLEESDPRAVEKPHARTLEEPHARALAVADRLAVRDPGVVRGRAGRVVRRGVHARVRKRRALLLRRNRRGPSRVLAAKLGLGV